MIDKWTHAICNDSVLQRYLPQDKNPFPVQRIASLPQIYATANVHFNQLVVITFTVLNVKASALQSIFGIFVFNMLG
jgi:hypothetical protein